MNKLRQGRRSWVAFVGIALGVPLFYLGGAPLLAVAINKLAPTTVETVEVVFKPAQFVYDRAGFYERYVDFVLDN